jgi:hypothetical protein
MRMSQSRDKTPKQMLTPTNPSSWSTIAAVAETDTVHVPSQTEIVVVLRCLDEHFYLKLPSTILYEEFMARIARKIKVIDPRRITGVLKATYNDEDGDQIVIMTSEDVQMMLELAHTGHRVTVEVTPRTSISVS